MSYLLENNTKNITEDIIQRKEFYEYKVSNDDSPDNVKHDHEKINIIPRFFIEKMIRDGQYLQFSSYQMFIANYINPNTPYSRLMVKWSTGVGKTIGALSVAMNFIQYYQKETAYGISNIGSVFVIGFTSAQFKAELLRFPEFGFITRQELYKLKLLKKAAYTGSKFDLENLQEFLIRIKKRFNNREGNGFFQFKGYKKLVNEIFLIQDSKINLSNLDEDGILKAIKEKKIVLNQTLLNQFKNSLIICDEIHNTYNSLEKNNWGIALQYILNYHPSVRAIFLSATPINNNPTEIVDLLNLLLPNVYYPNKLHKNELFDNNKQLKRGALDRIAELSKGRISYLRDVNPIHFPTKKFIGESIQGAPYLKFVRCPMSEFHYNTYKFAYSGSLSPESQYLVDFALPNPADSKIGIYQTSKIKKELQYANQQWKDDNKINYKKDRIVGDILRLKNLSKISNKFAEMTKTIINIINNQYGKIFIYHNVIHMSGVLFIQEILFQNNIIGEYDSSTANTLCSICGIPRKDHTKEQLGGGNPQTNIQTNDSIYENEIDPIYTKYNEITDSHEVYDSDDDIYNLPILEYKKFDDILVIPFTFINLKNTTNDKIVRIIESNSMNMVLENIIKNLGYFSLYTKNNGKNHYYTNSLINSLSQDDKQNLISKIKKIKNPKKNTLVTDAKTIGGRHKKKNKKSSNKKKNEKRKENSANKKSNDINSEKNTNHTYMPVRCIVAHSMIDRSAMNASLDKYNSPDNSDGARIMILIGGKIIKEAFDIKAVRELIVMGRPDNIPTLIQILGRAVRKGSHVLLPSNERNVNIRIFTSCLPIKTKINGVLDYALSYEEDKYVEKLQHYKIIQNIEKTLHENAIDAFINKDIIWPKEERQYYKSHKGHAELGSLYFEPNLPKKILDRSFTLSELNLETFNVFHSNDEINKIVFILKRLFIEKSTVWVYKDLLFAARNANKWFRLEFNTNLINESLFIVALTKLLWVSNTQYTEPIITHMNKQMSSVIDKLFDYDDKIILMPGNQKSIITQVGQYYILFPIDEVANQPIKDIELQYRINKEKESSVINIKGFLESGHSLIQYSDKRDRFYTKWNNVLIEDLEMAVCDFGTDFHIAFLEECIKYIFNVWTDANLKKSVMHSFYFKMLNYYDLRRLVIWGHTVKIHVFKKYTQFLNPVSMDMKKNSQKLENIKTKENDMNTSGLINLLKSSINKSDLNWISTGLKKQFENNLSESLKLFDGNYKKISMKGKKINADLVPIGHFLNYIPKFYHPSDGWFESPEYLEPSENFIESGVIVGYDERSKTGVHIRFKIRNPIQNIKQFKDSRLIEKGSVCSSKSKIYLKDIAKKIGITLKGKINVVSLCNDIRTKLIYLELKERMAKTKKKWFYFIYEKRPETILS
jgi:hypothetical protein